MDGIAGTRLMIVAPNPRFVRLFLADQIGMLVERGFSVQLLCAPDREENDRLADLPCEVRFINMARAIDPVSDCAALLLLVTLIERWRPAIVHGHGPKSGMLAAVAAWLCAVPVRLHTIHGLRSDGLQGTRRAIVRAMERLTFACSTRCLGVSHSLVKHVVEERLAAPAKTSVLRYQSWAGIALDHFCPIRHKCEGIAFRASLALPENAVLIAYVGRLARDKGIHTLLEAWQCIAARHPHVHLLVAGPADAADPLSPAILESLRHDRRVILREGFAEDVPMLLAASDIFVQPSLREGLGVAALEAAAMELPVVASRVTGLIDAVRAKWTGFLFRPQDASSLAKSLEPLLLHPELRRTMGQRGRRLVQARFSRQDVLNASLQMYCDIAARPDGISLWSRYGKRAFDLATSFSLLVLAAPLMLLVALAIWLFLSRPILFTQLRAGLHGRPIRVFKFRTMKSPSADQPMIGTDELRSHWLGSMLRKLSLDELPQLFNVLLGEMSLVGPRPLLLDYLPRYSERQRHRHDALPGITGWAQVHGRNSIPWEQRFELDLWYVQHRSARVDFHILIRTLHRVLSPQNITPNGQTSMPEFLGPSDPGPG